MKAFRNYLVGLLDPPQDGEKADPYDIIIMVTIIVSLIPLATKKTTTLLSVIDKVSVAIFIVDYLLRLCIADIKLQRGVWSFLLYPVTPMAIIDLVSILPSFTGLASGFRLLKLLRLLRTMRVFRALKMFRYSKSIAIIVAVIKKSKTPLLAVGSLALAYILISALLVFNVEPDTFGNFFDAIYWATVSLTTMGYGDIYPVTTAGRIVTILSSFVGIAIVALPSGIITAGYMDEINKTDDQ